MPEIIEQIGAYAGFAAMVGLAVLSALYFSQARDVKRLREWAGRAPEREPAERAALQARAQAAAQAAQQRAHAAPAPAAAAAQKPATAQQPAQPSAQPGKPAPASAAGATATASPAGAPPTPGEAKPPAAKPAAANGGPSVPPAGPAAPVRPAKAPPIGPPRVPAAQQTAILPPSARADTPWYRRLGLPEPRYVALIAAGILVIGGGAAFGITQLAGDETTGTPAGGGPDQAEEQRASNTPPPPSEITVSVLNGTTVTGLASQFSDALEEAGYDVGNADNFVDQAKAESVVLYAEGARPAARVVAKDLDISQIERIDPDSQRLGGNASVVVVLGADKTP